MKILNITEATSIALHSLVFIAGNQNNPVSVKQISHAIKSSENHISKILQRLATANFISSLRGPKGGFILNKQPENISLIDIYECIQGKIEEDFCPFKGQTCSFQKCIFGGIDKKISKEFIDYLSNTTLEDLI